MKTTPVMRVNPQNVERPSHPAEPSNEFSLSPGREFEGVTTGTDSDLRKNTIR